MDNLGFGIFDIDNGNGVFDVPTMADYQEWDNQKRLEADKKRRETATPEELADPYFDVPY